MIELLILFLFVVIGGLGIGFLIIEKKTHRLIIRDPMNRARYIDYIWVLEKKDKDTGVLLWKSAFGKKVSTPKPPVEAIEVGKKGRKFAECYRLTEDEFVWITDKGIEIQKTKDKKTGKETYKIMDIDSEGNLTQVDTFQPFSVTQRDVLVGQFKKAKEISGTGWTADKVIAAGSIGGILMVLVMLFIFWGDIAQPALDSHNLAQQTMQQNIELQNNIAKLANSLGVEIDNVEIKVAQTPNAQQGNTIIQQGTEDPPTR